MTWGSNGNVALGNIIFEAGNNLKVRVNLIEFASLSRTKAEYKSSANENDLSEVKFGSLDW